MFDRNALNAELEKVKSPPALPMRKTSATRSSTSCCVRVPTTRARTPS
ncbi:hypothetical protein [Comamonas sp. JC664]